MNGLYKISIIIPIYKVEKYIKQCVDSVLNQTYSNLEIILVDDGSPDNCPNICDDYALLDKRIKVIHKINGGLSDARNAGIKIATGDYLAFVDADDFVEVDMYETMLNDIEKSKAEVAICGRYYLYDNVKVVRAKQGIYLEMTAEEAIAKMNLNVFGYYDVASWDKLYLRELFQDIEYPVGVTSEDWFVTYKVLSKTSKVVYNSTPKYYYRQRYGSITHSKVVSLNPIIASEEVLEYVKITYPRTIKEAITSYVYASIGVYDNVILHSSVDKKLKSKIEYDIKKYYKDILSIPEVCGKRKMQLILLRHCSLIYCMTFKIFNFIRKCSIKE